MKRFILPIFLVCLFFLIPPKVQAAVIFQDTFENASQWVVGPTLGSGTGTWTIIDGKYGALVSGNSTIVRTNAIVDITTPNYVIDLDIFPVQGGDKNIDFRFGSSTGTYEVHFADGMAKNNFGLAEIPYVLVNHPLVDKHPYHIRIILNNQNFKFFVDNNLLFDKTNLNYVFNGHEAFALFVGTGSVTPSEVYFDNIVISTPDIKLNVLLLKQIDPLWGSQLYDNANLWSTGGTNISTWGCALTSAAMVFQYNGINKMPDNTNLNPGTMNSWLKLQPDGYVRNGLVNWLALSRLSRLASHSASVTFDALEYDRINHQDDALLGKHIAENVPPILEESGHFVVATGTDSANTTFFINDPYYSRTSLVDPGYNKNYLSMGTYTPSLTDLSYLMFVVDPSVSITLKDNNGVSVGEAYLQNPIMDPTGQTSSNGGALKVLYFHKPDSGNYSVVLSSNISVAYSLQSYEYDKNGNVKKGSFTGVVGSNNSDTYLINFDKENSNNSSANQEVTFKSLKNDIKTFYSLGKIKKLVFKNLLLLQVDLSEKLSTKSKRATKALLMMVIKSEIQREKGKSITTDAANILIDELNILISQF
jgi:hypothetical protein